MKKIIRILKCECAPRMLVKDSTGKFNGESAPLWSNSTGSCYIVQSALASKHPDLLKCWHSVVS